VHAFVPVLPRFFCACDCHVATFVQSLSNFARWRRGEATDDTRRFDLQQTAKDKKK
jgi:hypothetical protein